MKTILVMMLCAFIGFLALLTLTMYDLFMSYGRVASFVVGMGSLILAIISVFVLRSVVNDKN